MKRVLLLIFSTYVLAYHNLDILTKIYNHTTLETINKINILPDDNLFVGLINLDYIGTKKVEPTFSQGTVLDKKETYDKLFDIFIGNKLKEICTVDLIKQEFINTCLQLDKKEYVDFDIKFNNDIEEFLIFHIKLTHNEEEHKYIDYKRYTLYCQINNIDLHQIIDSYIITNNGTSTNIYKK